jgi:hypothetical protein
LRYRSLLFLLLMSLLLTVSCGTKPVAVVNGEKVSQERFVLPGVLFFFRQFGNGISNSLT